MFFKAMETAVREWLSAAFPAAPPLDSLEAVLAPDAIGRIAPEL